MKAYFLLFLTVVVFDVNAQTESKTNKFLGTWYVCSKEITQPNVAAACRIWRFHGIDTIEKKIYITEYNFSIDSSKLSKIDFRYELTNTELVVSNTFYGKIIFRLKKSTEEDSNILIGNSLRQTGNLKNYYITMARLDTEVGEYKIPQKDKALKIEIEYFPSRHITKE